jgi:hypothetical protein
MRKRLSGARESAIDVLLFEQTIVCWLDLNYARVQAYVHEAEERAGCVAGVPPPDYLIILSENASRFLIRNYLSPDFPDEPLSMAQDLREPPWFCGVFALFLPS